MKFDCGHDRNERSRIKNRELKEKVKFLTRTWQPKFAWMPVRVSSFNSVEDRATENKCVWLEWYERKLIPKFCSWSNRSVIDEHDTLKQNKWEVRELDHRSTAYKVEVSNTLFKERKNHESRKKRWFSRTSKY